MIYQWTTSDIDAFIAFCDTLSIADRTIPLRVWSNESNNDPTEHNPGGAAGLLQLEPATAKQLGYDVASDPHLDAFCQLSVSDQLMWAVKYFAPGRGRFHNVAAFYLWDFLPAEDTSVIADNPVAVVCGSRDGDPYPDAYRDNPGFDVTHKGYIITQDLTDAANRQYGPRAQAIAALVAQRASLPVDPGPPSTQPAPVDIGPAEPDHEPVPVPGDADATIKPT